ncbi:MAG TPA: orotidine-5'-phosphate decarboxylase, partial [Gammaproteobacteria bacterium]|nr:orotidine-5'-phosphate decarboxylase [Gammaproteobacteria bacterium]
HFDFLCGVPYTALPISTCLSLQHSVPMLIRRKEKKAYGTKQKIEGVYKANQRCLIIEDVITSGGSIIETAADLEEEGLQISDVAVLIDREQGGKENLRQKKYNLHAAFTATEVLGILADSSVISEAERLIVDQLLAERNHTSQRLSYEARVPYCKNELAKKLLLLMAEKKTNLAFSADLTSGQELLELANQLGSEICILKTHIDIIRDFSQDFINQLQALAKKHHFLIFEDRKFADIGHTAKLQYQDGIYHIADWADLVNAHSLPGLGLITGLAEVGLKKKRGLLLLAQMSSANNFLTPEYTEKTVALAKQFPEFVIGFISQQKLSSEPQWIYLTPGVHLSTEGDNLGQQYLTPERAILEQGSDIIIVGRGILKASDPLATAKQYRAAGWDAYQARINEAVSLS